MCKINNRKNFCCSKGKNYCIKCKISLAIYKNVLYYKYIIIYSGDLGIFLKIAVVLFVICAVFARFRQNNRNLFSEGTDRICQQIYIVTRGCLTVLSVLRTLSALPKNAV